MSDNEFVRVLTEEQASDHCDQLEMYYEEAEQVFGSLKTLLPKSEDVESYGSVHHEEKPALSADEPLGFLAVYPSQNAGVSMVIHNDAKTMKNSVKAVFPFIGEGNKYPCSIQNIQLYPNHLEAQISAFIDEDQNLLLNFYDTHYLDNRTFYNDKDTFQFIIRALAYCVEVNQTTDPNELKKIAGLVDKDSKDNLEIDAKNMIAVYPREDMGADHYEIQSPVQDIKEYGNINGEKVWQIGILLGTTPAGEDIPLDIYVTERSLNGSPLPKVGDNISAVVWLQGHLWGIGEE